MRSQRRIAIAATLWLAAYASADWPCEPQWTTFPSDRFTGSVTALVIADDGNGLRLYAGGSHLMRWSGMQWEQVGPQPPAFSRLAAFANTGNPALYALNAGTGVIRLTASGWEPAGDFTGSSGLGLLRVLDVGAGPRLFVCGATIIADGTSLGYVAQFDGTTWSAFGTWSTDLTPWQLSDLTTFDDGTGPALVLSVNSLHAPPSHRYVLRCRGDVWESIAIDTANGQMAAFDDGSGPALYFTSGHRWDGQAWTTTWPLMQRLAVFDDGTGPRLYGARRSSDVYDQTLLARWDGTTWQPVGPVPSHQIGTATTLLPATDPHTGQPKLFVGGDFTAVGPALPFQRIAAWNGTAWEPIGTNVDGVNHILSSLMPTDAPAPVGPALYATAGYSDDVTYSQRLLRWDGKAWTCIGTPVRTDASPAGVGAVIASTAGGVSRLYVTGSFTEINGVPAPDFAMWDGVHWQAMPRQMYVHAALTRQENGAEIAYFAGWSTDPLEGSCVVRWDGDTLTQIGQLPELGYYHSLVEYEGDLLLVMTTYARDVLRLLRWDGFAWEPLNEFLLYNQNCSDFDCRSALWSTAVVQTDAGPVLYALGRFLGVAGAPDVTAISWDGTTWRWGPAELPDLALAEKAWFFRETLPPQDVLYAKGKFTVNDVTGGLLRWDGADAELGADIPNYRVWNVATAPEPTFPGPAAYVAGQLTAINGQPTASLARWGCPPQRRGDADCSGQVDFADIDPFVSALGGPAAYRALHPTCNWFNADANCDGHVTFADIDPFVSCLGGGCAACP